METIALMLPNWIGDVAMATPAIRAVRSNFPQAHLLGVMRPYVAQVISGTPWLDETLLYTKNRGESLNRRQLVKELRQRNIDCMLLFPNSFSTALLAWLGGARQRVGYASHGRRLLLTHSIEVPRQHGVLQPHSAVDHYLEVAAAVGCTTASKQVELAVSAADQQTAKLLWRKYALGERAHVVAISAGGAYGSAKRWPLQHVTQLAKLITQQFAAKVLILCGPAERDEAAEIVSQADSPHVVSLAQERLSIGLSKACIERASVLVTTDSGPRHLAAAMNCPTISLFGSTDPRWAENYSAVDTKLSLPLDCAPCAERSCPLGHHRCMQDLTPELVVNALRTVLSKLAAQAA